MMNKIQKEDFQDFAACFELASSLENAVFLVTGATGLIGSTMVHCLLALGRNIKITCPVRSVEKARSMYGDEFEQVKFVETDLMAFLETLLPETKYQYIVHCASPTSGGFMTEHPVETFELAVESTRCLLDYSRKSSIDGFVYVSSLEYYGQNTNDEPVLESFQGYVDASSARSSYPLGKRAAEYLCFAFAKEYQVPVKIARLTQTFGAGVSSDDNRVFAQFARSVINETDIVLHTTGESAKPYCYTTDCISAILYILLRGKNGEAYNVANDETYISIKEMAEFLCAKFSSGTKVIVESRPDMGYAPLTKLNLSSKKLKDLGWAPKVGLKEMFERLINSIL